MQPDFSPEKYRHDLEIVRLTAAQVMKDLEVFGIDIHFSGDPYRAYDELLLQLVPILSGLYKNNASVFSALLYRIDLSEKEYRRIMAGAESMTRLSEAVIQREFKKVLIRKYFSSKD